MKKNSKIKRPKDVSQNVDFCACTSQNVVKHNASGKKGKLSCCKCIFHQIKANLAEIQPKNHQNVQKRTFLQKAPGVNGLCQRRIAYGVETWEQIVYVDDCDVKHMN